MGAAAGRLWVRFSVVVWVPSEWVVVATLDAPRVAVGLQRHQHDDERAAAGEDPADQGQVDRVDAVLDGEREDQAESEQEDTQSVSHGQSLQWPSR